MPSITVVSATRYDQRAFYLQSALGRSYSQTYSSFPVKLKIYYNNRKPLPVCYNDAVASALDSEETFVFVHDDVFILDFFWIETLHQGFEKFDVLGLAGNKRRVPRQPGWAFIDEKLTWDHPSNLSGRVGHGTQFPCQLTNFGEVGQQCKLLDGVLLAIKKSTLRKNDIRFDERFDFHFYDLDFCRQAEMHDLRIGTIPLCVIHESEGHPNSPQWKENYERYLMKWKE
jgi:GT2 family glycosyltransferase